MHTPSNGLEGSGRGGRRRKTAPKSYERTHNKESEDATEYIGAPIPRADLLKARPTPALLDAYTRSGIAIIITLAIAGALALATCYSIYTGDWSASEHTWSVAGPIGALVIGYYFRHPHESH